MSNKARKLVQTHRKLGETRFFLDRLREIDGSTASKDPAVFGYYLSAFLAAAHSVVEVFFDENGSSDCFKKWRAHLPKDDQNLFQFMKDQRRLEIHHKGAKYRMVDRADPTYHYPSVHALPLSILFKDVEFGPDDLSGLPVWVRVITCVPEGYFQIKQKRKKVIEVCRRYVELLEDLVTSCERQSR